uniref:non-specific serine/threonine protein kinase n=1 Tax=Rhizophora mucronata TaxID=61149 RepID=A0A2P2LAE4_RHIMU
MSAHLFFMLIFLPAYYCQNHPDYTECQKPYNCGHLVNLSYPFWGDNRPWFCGQEGFRLKHCQDQKFPIITTIEQDFRVIVVNQSSNTMTIARSDLYDGVCPQIRKSITFHQNLFRLVPGYANLSLAYNCTTSPFTTPTINNSCSIQDEPDRVFYGSDELWMRNVPEIGRCDRIEVPTLSDMPHLEETLLLPSFENGLEKVRNLLREGFNVSYDYDEDISICKNCKDSGGICGTNSSTFRFACFCAGDCQKLPDSKPKRQRLAVIIVSATAPVVLLLSILLYCAKRKMLRSKDKRSLSPVKSMTATNVPNLTHYSFANIEKATDGFSFKNKLGEGGYGPVYKGMLLGEQVIAVKKLSKTSTQGFEEFKNEVMLTAKLQHVNLVKVLGYCIEREEQMLIYEYMPNKSLDYYLFDPNRRCLLDWQKRVEIIEGIAQGLLYLQEYSRLTIIHRDLKASNILLDKDMKPKISDFGMARIFAKDGQEANTGRIVGTYGYVPPEYVEQGAYSTKSDVYSFGVLLLQIISGKRNACFYGLNEDLSLLDYVSPVHADIIAEKHLNLMYMWDYLLTGI